MRDDLAALLPQAEVAAVDAATDDGARRRRAHRHRSRAPPGAARRARPVGLVAFLELDQELLAPRARAAEQALWLLVRAARLLGPRAAKGVLLAPDPAARARGGAVGRERGEPLRVADAERGRRRALGFPPFGGLAELSGAAVAVGGRVRRAARRGRRSPCSARSTDGKRALVRAATVDDLCDALASPASRPRTRSGRLRVDVDPRRV